MVTMDLKGGEVVKAMAGGLAERVAKLKAKGVNPALAIVRVGEKPDDIYYQQSAAKRCKALGVAAEIFAYGGDISEDELVNEIINLNLDESIHGILILRPLPGHIDDSAVCGALDPSKDVDGVTDVSLAGVMKGDKRRFSPCTARAVVEILDHYSIETVRKHAVVIGRSLVVGKPLSLMLTARDATVTVCHTKTPDLKATSKRADIVIAAAGRGRMVNSDYIKEGAVVVDVGINTDENGKLCGDVDYTDIQGTASAVTPVPGGVGAVTTAVLAAQVIEAAERLGSRG